MNTFSRSWGLIVQSFSVLRKDKKLIVFPVLSTLATLAVAAAYIVPLFRMGVRVTPAFYGWLFLWYCTNYFVIIFFNCALAACVGGEATLSGGMNQAATRLGKILLWTIVASTAGVILRAIEQRSGWIGKLVSAILGIAWALATYLVVPVLVFEDQNVFRSIKRSGELLRRTWGEQVSGGIGLGLPSMLLAIPGILLAVIGMRIHPLGFVAAVLYFLLLSAVMSAVKGIFAVALYRYATKGDAPAGFSQTILNGAFVNLNKT